MQALPDAKSCLVLSLFFLPTTDDDCNASVSMPFASASDSSAALQNAVPA